MERTLLHLPVILLAFSHLISLGAVPLTRSQNFLQDHQRHLGSGNTHQEMTADWENELINGRMVLVNNDYPGSGANNHHIPRPPGLGGRN